MKKRMNHRLKNSFTLLLCLLGIVAISPAAMAFDTPAKQAILIDSTTGTTLLAKNADTQMGPSSMSKIMTVYIVFEQLQKGELSLDDTFYISEKSWKKGGSKMFVKVGDKVRVEDLLRGVIVQSGNDASIALAEGIAGSEEMFAQVMNAKAAELGLKGSNFANSTGWPDEKHYMTARDLAVLSEAMIRKFPKLYKYWAEKEFTYSGITQQNRNSLVGSMGIDGLKTGHTEAAGYGVVVSGEQNGRRLISVVNGLDSKAARISASRELLTYGFGQFKIEQLFADRQTIDEAKVWYGVDKTVPLIVEKPLLMTLPKFDRKDVKASITLNEPVAAPIAKGQKLGTLTLSLPNSDPAIFALVAGKAVEESSGINNIFRNIRHYLLSVE